MSPEPASPLCSLRGVGPRRSALLTAAGFTTVGDLLYHLPHRFEDRRGHRPVAAATEGAWVSLTGRLTAVRVQRTRRRGRALVRALLVDGSGELAVVWFNQPYLASRLDVTRERRLFGRIRRGRAGDLELINPTLEPIGEEGEDGRVVPVYPALPGLGPAAVRRILASAIAACDPRTIPEPLPVEVLARHDLPSLGEALAALHRPGAEADAAALNARRSPAHLRLIYGELLELQLELAALRELQVREPQPFRYRIDDRVLASVRRAAPFRLTGAQKRALREIVDDLRSPYPMLRLLQGDVGSGKTVVAVLALVVALECGLQGAFMAPTELLAEQHYGRLRHLLGDRFRLGLLTRSTEDLGRRRRELSEGDIQLAVGTHALIQEGTAFRHLGLAVVDEQHRFGVLERRLLEGKGRRPDLLVMSATPIPRSLALTVYGDLAVSTLDELPPGRREVATEVVPARRRAAVYRDLARDLEAGARAYVVFPLIEGSGTVSAGAVAGLGEAVRRRLGGFPSAVVHGRMPAAERADILRSFAAGRVRVLLATTVIEVGIDVPEATWMVIESGERFGLAQLHQLRGRVGRGSRFSRCVVVHGRLSPQARRRLDLFAATTDGFAIAEADLELRGPGDLLGTRQSGLPALRTADLVRDRRWLERARHDARELLPRLGEPALAALRGRVEPRLLGRERSLGGG